MNNNPLLNLIADIRNRTLSARYIFKRLRDNKINEVQAVLDFGKELDKIDKILSEYEKETP